jgi:hypothetical protein
MRRCLAQRRESRSVRPTNSRHFVGAARKHLAHLLCDDAVVDEHLLDAARAEQGLVLRPPRGRCDNRPVELGNRGGRES